jgi:uncharacterized surface protein with fasciclin (FAS1) repeats
MDAVLLPAEEELSLPTMTLLDLVYAANEESGEFQSLLDLLLRERDDAERVEGRVALMDLLGDPNAGPFTVFLPTDAAFGSFPSSLKSIVNDVNNVETLRSFLEFHVLLHSAEAQVNPILDTQVGLSVVCLHA